MYVITGTTAYNEDIRVYHYTEDEKLARLFVQAHNNADDGRYYRCCEVTELEQIVVQPSEYEKDQTFEIAYRENEKKRSTWQFLEVIGTLPDGREIEFSVENGGSVTVNATVEGFKVVYRDGGYYQEPKWKLSYVYTTVTQRRINKTFYL